MSRIKRAVVMAVGSGGDVAPMASVAAKLADRGLESKLLAPERYQHFTEGTTAKFQSIGADEVFSEVFDGNDIWHPLKGFGAAWHYYGAAMRSGFQILRQGWDSTDTILVSSSFAVAARFAEELDGYRNTTVHLSPSIIFSAHQPSTWPSFSIPPAWPLFLKRWMMTAAERWATDPVIGAQVNPYRIALGLSPQKRFFSQWLHSPRRVIYAFPEWFAAPAEDWPVNGTLAGFPNGIHRNRLLPDKLESFLRDGDAPVVVITAGSAVASRPSWVERMADFSINQGARVVVIGPVSHADREDKYICRITFAPFETLLGRAHLIVHHAGIGTMAEAMRAGLPQLLVPMAHDQADNAARLQKLGFGRKIDSITNFADIEAAWHWTFNPNTRKALQEAKQKLSANGDGTNRIVETILADLGDT
ncbi:rhamnosyltransferase subunit B [Nitrosomonas oligotropha]|uniref:Rhamnosyltransferase subunit B n=1 Tax=Nitrosomonas oligotropha TaxID=42354 RepID=A0A2T5I0Q3_9PROT|nr:glycosyltransferase [Nitrosomonas oligotropha]PTQ77396.1 rhamnosyltransferase subunit B [Nitrosomonas oligotropha]